MRKLHLEASYVEEARKFQERLCRSGEEGRVLQIPVEKLFKPGGHMIEMHILGSLIGAGSPGQVIHSVVKFQPLVFFSV